MTRPNIRDWARDHVRVTDTPRGDFIAALRDDSSFNRDELVDYLACWRRACPEALKQARLVFAQHARWCRRNEECPA
jgi:hypothetical protein